MVSPAPTRSRRRVDRRRMRVYQQDQPSLSTDLSPSASDPSLSAPDPSLSMQDHSISAHSLPRNASPSCFAGGRGCVGTARGPGRPTGSKHLPPLSIRLGPDENCHNTSTWSCLPPLLSRSPHTVSPAPKMSRRRVYPCWIRVYQPKP